MGTDNEGEAEACGRCSMTSVVGMAAEEGTGRNPFDGPRIELEDDELRAASPHVVALGRLKDRIDRWAASFTYGR